MSLGKQEEAGPPHTGGWVSGGTRVDPSSHHTCSQAFHSRDVVPKPARTEGSGWRPRREWSGVSGGMFALECRFLRAWTVSVRWEYMCGW